MWQIILPVVVVYLLTILIWLFLTFDGLVRLEYVSYRPEWEKDGRPRGYFWIAPEDRRSFRISFRREWAFNRINFVWTFSTPNWMRENPQAVLLVRRFRMLIFLWNASFIAIPALIAILANRM
jgi:hypothetical protein